MKEDFLHYVWQYQLFNKQQLSTTEGESVEVQTVGLRNTNSGPDFKEAKIKIGKQLWAGNVEIHLKSSDWYAHNHENDTAYDSVILHVVWEYDMPVFRKNNTLVSTIELKGLVTKHIYANYLELYQNNSSWIACEKSIASVDTFTWQHWKERLYIERLERKSKYIESLLQATTNDWEAALFQLLMKNFGLKVNGTSFATIAAELDYKLVRKEKTKTYGLEALFMGQAGLLEADYHDAFYKKLQEIYHLQQNKYQLKNTYADVKFFRLRPPNFPTIRLSQLANLFSKYPDLFDDLMQIKMVSEFYELFKIKASDYWDTHYVFDKESKKSSKKLTKSFIDLLLINTVIPLKFAYQKSRGVYDSEDILQLIKQLKPETNSTVAKYRKLGIDVKNALDSQALLTLKKSYCDTKSCLSCSVGMKILARQ